MKHYGIISVLLILAASVCFAGCETLDAVRANPISLEINGVLFRSYPDTSAIIIPTDPEQIFKQYDDSFTLELCEDLYSPEREKLVLRLIFSGEGKVELNQRYTLSYPEDGPADNPLHFISYQGRKHEASEGWIEFSEFGTNDSGDRVYASGTFGVTLKDKALKTTNGSFGRLIEFEYINHQSSLK